MTPRFDIRDRRVRSRTGVNATVPLLCWRFLLAAAKLHLTTHLEKALSSSLPLGSHLVCLLGRLF